MIALPDARTVPPGARPHPALRRPLRTRRSGFHTPQGHPGASTARPPHFRPRPAELQVPAALAQGPPFPAPARAQSQNSPRDAGPRNRTKPAGGGGERPGSRRTRGRTSGGHRAPPGLRATPHAAAAGRRDGGLRPPGPEEGPAAVRRRLLPRPAAPRPAPRKPSRTPAQTSGSGSAAAPLSAADAQTPIPAVSQKPPARTASCLRPGRREREAPRCHGDAPRAGEGRPATMTALRPRLAGCRSPRAAPAPRSASGQVKGGGVLPPGGPLRGHPPLLGLSLLAPPTGVSAGAGDAAVGAAPRPASPRRRPSPPLPGAVGTCTGPISQPIPHSNEPQPARGRRAWKPRQDPHFGLPPAMLRSLILTSLTIRVAR